MSWSAAFASGEFKLFWVCRNRGTCRSFCGAAANCLRRNIWCGRKLVWACYVSCVRRAATVRLKVAARAVCDGRRSGVAGELYIIYML